MWDLAAPPSPLGGHQFALFLLQIGVLLGMAVGLGSLAVRFSLPPLVGELLTGVVLGPSLLGVVAPGLSEALFPQDAAQFGLIDAVGQLGMILFVAVTGMNIDLRLIRRRGATAAKVSLPGLVIPLALGVGAGTLVPATMLQPGSDRLAFALFLGIAMCVSAIPVIAKTLMDLKLLHRNIGQLILVAGTIDDVVGWLGLSIVTAIATTGLRAGGVLRSLIAIVLFILLAATLGRPLVKRLLRFAARSGHDGVTVAVAVIVVLCCATVTQTFGMEAVFGALVAGILIQSAGTDVLSRLGPLRGFVMAVLVPVFFATAGLRIDLTALVDPMVLGVGVVFMLIAVVGKFSGAFIGGGLSGLSRWECVGLGAGMNARGVVEVVVAMVGVRLGVLSTATYTIIVLIAVVTSLMGPPILRAAMSRIETTADERLRRSAQEAAEAPRPQVVEQQV